MLDFIKENIWNILIVLNYVIAASAVITILLKNINPTKTLSYIIVLVFFPFLGIVVYYLFGQEYRKTKIFNRKYILNKNVVKSIKEELEFNRKELEKVDRYLEDKVKLVKLIHCNENEPLTLNNKIDLLKNGDIKFEYLIEDIKSAEHHIHFEYYIIKDDTIGTQVLDLLCEKAKEGLEVRLIYDDVGTSISNKMKSKLTNSGVLHHPFMPVLFSGLTGKMNYRNHRKIAIVDGKIGYVGGINVADNYLNDNNSKGYWRDTHLRIEGDAVKSLQIHFLSSWDFVSTEKPSIKKTYFPEIKPRKTKVPLQIVASGPDTDWANIMEIILTAISTANDYVYITTPYFVPNDEIISALQIAAKTGVDVRLIIPEKSDSWIVKHASNSYLDALLKTDIKVYKYNKGFVHAKTIVVDDVFSSVGTSNMDYRSFNINFEINTLIYDKKNSKLLKEHFLEDMKNSTQVNYDTYLKRSKLDKVKESYCRLWSPLI
ncbi:cardiolipin synthase [Sabulilitoribacter multivorans]|uniref:Cardiolipin synthase n=1 Tax=Flaviramulus multivorans TaxID=1304750 RepID=A0ABS9IL99_9FLAO|nr:cardiolipin synthase [Flaviramulus multivorans]MCF7561374.1 cardiolipin synthase [Flaviramulus multivorans]